MGGVTCSQQLITAKLIPAIISLNAYKKTIKHSPILGRSREESMKIGTKKNELKANKILKTLSQKKTKFFIQKLLLVIICYYIIFDFYFDYTIWGSIDNGIHRAIGQGIASAMVLIITYMIYPYVKDIKVTFYRVFLGAIFKEESKPYLWMHRAFLLKILAVVLSLGWAISVSVFLMLLKVHVFEYLMLASLSILFFILDLILVNKKIYCLKDKVSYFICSYAPLVICVSLASGILLLKEYLIPSPALDIDDILLMSSSVVSIDEISFKPLRVAVRHAYALELLPRSIKNLETIGNELYLFFYVFSCSITHILGFFLIVKNISNNFVNRSA